MISHPEKLLFPADGISSETAIEARLTAGAIPLEVNARVGGEEDDFNAFTFVSRMLRRARRGIPRLGGRLHVGLLWRRVLGRPRRRVFRLLRGVFLPAGAAREREPQHRDDRERVPDRLHAFTSSLDVA